MSEKDLSICRDMQLAIMGHILINQYGGEPLDFLMKWQNEITKKRWAEIAESTGRKDPRYFLCLFSERAHEFEVIRYNGNALEVKVTRCVHADAFKKLNATRIGEKLICAGDVPATEGFNPEIGFRRPKLLMASDDCCHFVWELPI